MKRTLLAMALLVCLAPSASAQAGAPWGVSRDQLFSLYKLNYLAIGNEDGKIQFSFQYRFLQDVPAFLTFTSVSAWDIDRDSNPARDINFNPELFYRWDLSGDQAMQLDGGFWHKSNGEDGPESRNWDRLFARGIFAGEFLGREFTAAPTIYLGLPDSDSNIDFEEYLGHWDASFFWRDLLFLNEEGNDLDLLVEVVGGKGSLTVGLQYRFESYAFNPNLYMQFFTGYGDTQLTFDEKDTQLRFGISIY